MALRPRLNRRAAAALALAALAAAVLPGCQKPADAPAFKAVDITGATYGQALVLPDVDGRLRSLADFKGQVTVVFFGYTHCPDVCPATMAELAQVKQALGADGVRVQGVFVTLDPERDSAALLKGYTQAFSPDFVALRGSPEQTEAVAKQFKIFYAKVPGKASGSYSVDHTAGSYIFDTQGRLRLFTRYGSGAEALRHDLKLLLDGR